GASTLAFIYDTGEVGFRMKRQARPTQTFVTKVKDTFATATKTRIDDPTPSHWTGQLPDALASRVRDLEIADGRVQPKASTYTVDGDQVFSLEWGTGANAHIEVFAQNSQLHAKSRTVEPLAWVDLKP